MNCSTDNYFLRVQVLRVPFSPVWVWFCSLVTVFIKLPNMVTLLGPFIWSVYVECKRNPLAQVSGPTNAFQTQIVYRGFQALHGGQIVVANRPWRTSVGRLSQQDI